MSDVAEKEMGLRKRGSEQSSFVLRFAVQGPLCVCVIISLPIQNVFTHYQCLLAKGKGVLTKIHSRKFHQN